MSTADAGIDPPERTDLADEPGLALDFLHDMPAWGISLIVHVAILLLFFAIPVVIHQLPVSAITSVVTPEEVLPEEYVLSTEPTEEIGSESDLNIAGASMAMAKLQGADNHLEETPTLVEELINPNLRPQQDMLTPNEAEMVEELDLTGTTEHAGGTDGAIDRITQEIAASVRERQTLVVWMMDESKSMERRREEVAERFESIYRQLGQLDIGADQALRTGIVSYGKDVHFVQPEPTADLELLNKGVASIKNDPSGLENVFGAISATLKKFKPAQRKLKAELMLILVTDERGDDYNQLEQVVRRCSLDGVKVYCIGNASVFGREKGQVYMEWEADGEQFEGYLPADMGPETVKAEGLQLPFWTASANGLDRMSAGYGPYTMSRLCTETGGIFFLAEDTRKFKWEPAVMRRYAPDYRPVKDYIRELETNKAKWSLISAAELAPIGGDAVPIPVKAFRADNDNVLRQEITEAQKPMATVDHYFQRLQTTLETGERDREKMDSDRWRASYDLAMGRVLAMRVRAFGYNALLAEMKGNPKSFEKEGNNQWRLRPSTDVTGGANVRKLEKKAMKYLQRVVDEHPGTPWAYLASVEIGDPLGWEWVEGRMQIAAANMGGGGNNAPQFAPEEEARRREQRRRQQKMKASQPKI